MKYFPLRFVDPGLKCIAEPRGEFSSADRGDLISKHVSTHASTKEGDTEEWRTAGRVLSIPSIRDRMIQGALKLILEPIFEADFQLGSYRYRPKRTAHETVHQSD
jgi:hypothetical protein